MPREKKPLTIETYSKILHSKNHGNHFILINKAKKRVSLLEWAEWFERTSKRGNKERIVKQETIGAYKVSTVFLGLDHNFTGKGESLLYETMIFDKEYFENEGKGKNDIYARCSTWGKAEKQHQKAVESIRNKINEIF